MIDNFKVVMITGDNPLTACHVAKELLFLRKSGGILLLSNLDNTWFWCSIDETTKLPLTTESKKLTSKYDFCITGDVSFPFYDYFFLLLNYY